MLNEKLRACLVPFLKTIFCSQKQGEQGKQEKNMFRS